MFVLKTNKNKKSSRDDMLLQKLKDEVEVFRFESFGDTGLTHFVTTRHQGVSDGRYSTFNMGRNCGDDIVNVNQNRDKLQKLLELSTPILIPNQVHEDKICIVDSSFLSLTCEEQYENLYGKDAIITDQKRVCVSVTTADCVPILIYDTQFRVFAAIHAGWKGTVARLASKMVNLICERWNLMSQDLIVGIGPSICPAVFEVGKEVGDRFEASGFDLSKIGSRNKETGKLHIDLWEANKQQLIEVGILSTNIEVAGICTYLEKEYFFSARRQGFSSGRMLSGGFLR